MAQGSKGAGGLATGVVDGETGWGGFGFALEEAGDEGVAVATCGLLASPPLPGRATSSLSGLILEACCSALSVAVVIAPLSTTDLENGLANEPKPMGDAEGDSVTAACWVVGLALRVVCVTGAGGDAVFGAEVGAAAFLGIVTKVAAG